MILFIHISSTNIQVKMNENKKCPPDFYRSEIMNAFFNDRVLQVIHKSTQLLRRHKEKLEYIKSECDKKKFDECRDKAMLISSAGTQKWSYETALQIAEKHLKNENLCKSTFDLFLEINELEKLLSQLKEYAAPLYKKSFFGYYFGTINI